MPGVWQFCPCTSQTLGRLVSEPWCGVVCVKLSVKCSHILSSTYLSKLGGIPNTVTDQHCQCMPKIATDAGIMALEPLLLHVELMECCCKQPFWLLIRYKQAHVLVRYMQQLLSNMVVRSASVGH